MQLRRAGRGRASPRTAVEGVRRLCPGTQKRSQGRPVLARAKPNRVRAGVGAPGPSSRDRGDRRISAYGRPRGDEDEDQMVAVVGRESRLGADDRDERDRRAGDRGALLEVRPAELSVKDDRNRGQVR